MKKDQLTIIIILHNRHKNIDRLYDFYKQSDYLFILADSSTEKYIFKEPNDWQHFYTPGYTFTQKIEYVLQKVKTPFVAMCADDDFLLLNALEECVSFLSNNSSYSIAQGYAIRYLKESVTEGKIHFQRLYRSSRSLENNDPSERVRLMFEPYRSVLYAVFRTEVLFDTFLGSGKFVKNLFLNEYLTAFIPIVRGKYKELSLLYQIREHSLDSDDKTAVDLDTLVNSNDVNEQNELHEFKEFVYQKIEKTKGIDISDLDNIIYKFSLQLSANRKTKISFKKRVGQLIALIPFLGSKVIKGNRERESKKELETLALSGQDRRNMLSVEQILLQHK